MLLLWALSTNAYAVKGIGVNFRAYDGMGFIGQGVAIDYNFSKRWAIGVMVEKGFSEFKNVQTKDRSAGIPLIFSLSGDLSLDGWVLINFFSFVGKRTITSDAGTKVDATLYQYRISSLYQWIFKNGVNAMAGVGFGYYYPRETKVDISKTEGESSRFEVDFQMKSRVYFEILFSLGFMI